MVFTGEYEHTIDAKGRLAIPADIRSLRTQTDQPAVWYAVPSSKGVIRLYTQQGFEERAAAGPKTLMPGRTKSEIEVTLFGLTARVEEDSAGRIRVPDQTLKLTGLGTSVVLVGANDRLEIRDRDTWQKSKAEMLARLSAMMDE